MDYFLKNVNSKNLLLFFAGWACDEYEFSHLQSNSDVLILYNYHNLELDFDFSKYEKFNLLAFSAGVFVSSIFRPNLKYDKKIAVCGNPYLFDKHLGLSDEMIKIFKETNEENCADFRRNYLVANDVEYERLLHSIPKRSFESCNLELDCLKELYDSKNTDINPDFDIAYAGEFDPIFKLETQKETFKNKLQTVSGARHNIFFRINSFEDIFEGRLTIK